MSQSFKSEQGEAAAETLASIFIAVLSVGVLLFAVMISSGTDSEEAGSPEFYDALTAAELQQSPAGEARVNIESGSGGGSMGFDVELYGRDGVYSYVRQNGSGEQEAPANGGGDTP